VFFHWIIEMEADMLISKNPAANLLDVTPKKRFLVLDVCNGLGLARLYRVWLN
jgi:hypothetical protein